MMLAEHDRVVLTADVSDSHLKAGDVGTIVRRPESCEQRSTSSGLVDVHDGVPGLDGSRRGARFLEQA
jgi:hypothetical protein